MADETNELVQIDTDNVRYRLGQLNPRVVGGSKMVVMLPLFLIAMCMSWIYKDLEAGDLGERFGQLVKRVIISIIITTSFCWALTWIIYSGDKFRADKTGRSWTAIEYYSEKERSDAAKLVALLSGGGIILGGVTRLLIKRLN